MTLDVSNTSRAEPAQESFLLGYMCELVSQASTGKLVVFVLQ